MHPNLYRDLGHLLGTNRIRSLVRDSSRLYMSASGPELGYQLPCACIWHCLRYSIIPRRIPVNKQTTPLGPRYVFSSHDDGDGTTGLVPSKSSRLGPFSDQVRVLLTYRVMGSTSRDSRGSLQRVTKLLVDDQLRILDVRNSERLLGEGDPQDSHRFSPDGSLFVASPLRGPYPEITSSRCTM